MGEYINSGKQVLFRNYEEGGTTPLIHIADAVDTEKAHFLATMANAPKGEDGSFLPAFDYVAEASVTLSPQFHGELVSLGMFHGSLDSAIEALSGLDKVKKSLFYGKDNGLWQKTGVAPHCQELPGIIGYSSATEDGGYVTDEEATNLIHGIIGLATEAGELLELLRDTLDGKPLDRTNLQEEVGDGKWYMAILAKVGRFMWGDDERLNIAKLRKRFPDKFTEYDANNRNLEAERLLLESGDSVNQLALPISQRTMPMEGETHIPPFRTQAERDAAVARYEASGGYIPGESKPLTDFNPI